MTFRTLPHALTSLTVALMLAVGGLTALAPQADAAAALKQRAHGQLRTPVKHGKFRVSQRFHSGHPGVDLAAPRGTKIRAAVPGRVVKVRKMRTSYGKHVVIKHRGGRSLSAHMRGIRVHKGERVDKGEVIGTVGTTGNSSGPHLHFVLLKKGRVVNPAPYLWK